MSLPMQIEALIERLEGLSGPDREVDLDIAIATGQVSDEVAKYGPYLRRIERRRCDPVTASLDAAVALVEKVLPGWYWRTGRTSLFPKGWAYISRLHPSHCDRDDEAACADGKAASPAIALLIAMLRALAAGGSDAR